MKKIALALCVTLPMGFLFAGGDLSPVEPIAQVKADNTCDKDMTYVQTDKNLMWQDQSYTDAEDGAYARTKNIGKVGTFTHAMGYCRTLNYAGYSDWRLPTSDELQSVHRIDGQVFTYFRDKDFWTSTPTTEGKYYVVFPADAYIYKRNKSETNYVRCVRCTNPQELDK